MRMTLQEMYTWLTVETAGYKNFHPLEMIQIQSMGAKSQYEVPFLTYKHV